MPGFPRKWLTRQAPPVVAPLRYRVCGACRGRPLHRPGDQSGRLIGWRAAVNAIAPTAPIQADRFRAALKEQRRRPVRAASIHRIKSDRPLSRARGHAASPSARGRCRYKSEKTLPGARTGAGLHPAPTGAAKSSFSLSRLPHLSSVGYEAGAGGGHCLLRANLEALRLKPETYPAVGRGGPARFWREHAADVAKGSETGEESCAAPSQASSFANTCPIGLRSGADGGGERTPHPAWRRACAASTFRCGTRVSGVTSAPRVRLGAGTFLTQAAKARPARP